jgi:integral membrane protein
VSPSTLFRRVAVAEAVTWALLLTGMVLKYSGVTEVGVRIFGMVHGVVFIAYGLTTVLVAVDQRWTARRTLLGLVSAVPPFMTVWFDRYAERRGALAPHWRLATGEPRHVLDRAVAWLLRNPLRGALAGLVAVLALTGVALLAGPPVG